MLEITFRYYSIIIDTVEVEKIIQETDVKILTKLIPSILNYDPEKMSPTRKIFRLSQLVIDLLLNYIKNTASTNDEVRFKTNYKILL